MYSVMIVEDEYATRNALANMVRWEECGFYVAEKFASGNDALEYLKTGHTPNVILTDIEMSNGSGIEIAGFVKKHSLNIKIVFLTGYREFSYAQKAIEYGVEQYLLKPVNPSRIVEVFKEIRDKLDELSRKEKQIEVDKRLYSELINYEKQQLISDLYFGALVKEADLERRLRLLHLPRGFNGNSRLVLTRVTIPSDHQYIKYVQNFGMAELQEQIMQILNCCNDKVEFYAIAWSGEEKESTSVQGVFWLKQFSDKDILNTDDMIGAVYNLTELQVEISILEELGSFEELALYSRRIVDDTEQSELSDNAEYRQLLNDQRHLLCSYLCQNNLEQGMELAGTLCQNYLRNGVAFAQKYCIDTIVHLLDATWDETNAEIRDKVYEHCMNEDVLSSMSKESLMDWMQSCVRYIFDEGAKKQLKQENSIKKVMQYIQTHYTEDLTLARISEHVYLNPSYISRMVKTQIGKNVTDLVTEMRIEKAVELLKTTDLKIYTIAERVGYTNLQYFYRVFRRITGKVPNDFR